MMARRESAGKQFSPRRLWVLVPSLLILGLSASSLTLAESGGGLSVKVVPASDPIRAMDPLFVRIEVHNNQDHEARFDQPIHTSTGVLAFQIREGEGAFESITVPNQGRKQVVSLGGPSVMIPAGATHVVHELLFFHYRRRRAGAELRPVFSAVGEVEVRVNLTAGDRRLTSVPATVQIRPVSEEDRELIASNSAFLDKVVSVERLPYQLFTKADVEKVGTIYRKLGPSRLKTILKWAVRILKTRSMNEQEATRKLRQLLEQERNALTPIWETGVTFWIACEFAHRKLWQAAAEVAETLPEDYYDAEKMKRIWLGFAN